MKTTAAKLPGQDDYQTALAALTRAIDSFEDAQDAFRQRCEDVGRSAPCLRVRLELDGHLVD